jgi:hypothetical protein
VLGQFVLLAPQHSQIVGFQVAAYDTSKPLIIDPVLTYATYLGGSSGDQGHGIAVDAAGDMYVTGRTCSTDFPIANAFQPTFGGGGVCFDAFVTKLDATGSTLIYSTYLGGTGNDIGYGIAVDADGNAYVTGSTASLNFPTAPKVGTTCLAFQCSNSPCCTFIDAFVTKLDPNGGLTYSTYLGGGGGETGYGIAVDNSPTPDIYIVGFTTPGSSNPFPTHNPLQATPGGSHDAFLTKLSTNTGLIYSTYLGGSANDIAYSVAVDTNRNAYITGSTSSLNFPTANAFQSAPGSAGITDAFAVKVSADGSTRIYATYLGGGDADEGNGIAVDSGGNAYITGMTQSRVPPLFPTQNALQPSHGGGVQDAFVTKFGPAGSVVYSTFLGGSTQDWGKGIAVDSWGNAYVTGFTAGSSFPTLNPLQACNTNQNVFVTQLNPTGSALGFSTCLGGSNHEQGHGITVDTAGNAYITGYTNSANFLTVSPYQQNLGSINQDDSFVVKISFDADGDGVPTPQDCNDNDAAIHPGAAELCNGQDDDCDGAVDESPTNPLTPLTQACYSGPSGTASVGVCQTGTQTCLNGAFGDCVGEVTPTAETCNGLDDDCNGSIDDGVLTTFYHDGDHDGFGNAAVTQQACLAPPEYVDNNTDCNDANATVYPGAPEICGDGIDQDCDGTDLACSTTYQPSGLCLGEPGHVILQPINADGTSVFKQGSTVSAKFRVCDTDGVSVGHSGVVTEFKLVQVVQGTITQTVNESVSSTTPDSAFRWDAAAQQWIFNISTKSLMANQTYFYRISLDDGSFIDFQFGLRK